MKSTAYACIGVLAVYGCSGSIRPDSPQGFGSLEDARDVLLAPFIQAPDPHSINGFVYRQFNGWGGAKAENLSIVRRHDSATLDATYVRYKGTALYRIAELWDKGLRQESDFIDDLREESVHVSSVECPALQELLSTLTQHVLNAARSGVPGDVRLVYTDSPVVRHYTISNGESASTEVSEVELEGPLYSGTRQGIEIVRRCANNAG